MPITGLGKCNPRGNIKEDKGGEDGHPQLHACTVQGANHAADAAEGLTEGRDQHGLF
jgi:hypothetical protein